MELRAFAERILTSADLASKLASPVSELTDEQPGKAIRIDIPARIAELRFVHGKRGVKMPKDQALHDARLRGAAHHVMANHELQALEIMAWVLLAFPEAPESFRRGLVWILQEEQEHTRWHIKRSEELGVPFGSLPVAGYVWRRAIVSRNIAEYCACLPMTFEAANLDHSLHYEQLFRKAGDESSAGVMSNIHHDEIRHVKFGVTWLRRFKNQGSSDWDAYLDSLHWPLKPKHARGKHLDESSRRNAGLEEDFITHMRAHVP